MFTKGTRPIFCGFKANSFQQLELNEKWTAAIETLQDIQAEISPFDKFTILRETSKLIHRTQSKVM